MKTKKAECIRTCEAGKWHAPECPTLIVTKEKYQPTHTPTPWSYENIAGHHSVNMSNGDSFAVESEADAKHIVRAVNSFEKNEKELEFLRNSHEELLEALKLLFNCFSDGVEGNYEAVISPDLVKELRKTIAKAEGGAK